MDKNNYDVYFESIIIFIHLFYTLYFYFFIKFLKLLSKFYVSLNLIPSASG